MVYIVNESLFRNKAMTIKIHRKIKKKRQKIALKITAQQPEYVPSTMWNVEQFKYL